MNFLRHLFSLIPAQKSFYKYSNLSIRLFICLFILILILRTEFKQLKVYKQSKIFVLIIQFINFINYKFHIHLDCV